MSSVKIDRNPDEKKMKALGVFSWPIWTKEVSSFPWTYDEDETCYLLEGEVEVTPIGEETVRFGKGDLVTFPKGMECRWNVKQAVRKHYRFGS